MVFVNFPPSWICDDVIILHPIHCLNIVLNFCIDWFRIFHTSLACSQLVTDRETDTDIAESILPLMCVTGLNKLLLVIIASADSTSV